MANNAELMSFLENVPIGTIMPLGADITDSAISTMLNEEGWLPCIGLSLKKSEYRSLFDVILYQFGGAGDFFNLPDLRGLFARGAQAPNSAGPGGVVGAVQESSTYLPTNPFSLEQAGEHQHTLVNLPTDSRWTYYTAGHTTAAWEDGSPTTNAAGAHSHVVNVGGDKETRALNVYVDFVIKYKDVA
ncbi:MAG TPA: phage tail protein [Ktedonobacteraceae bacterium]